MKKLHCFLLLTLGLAILFSFSCQRKADLNQQQTIAESEESGTQYAKTDTCDVVRKGVRLVLFFDESSEQFTGTVENTTEATIRAVKVEVHLSNGTELGPTTPIDLAAGEKAEVVLSAAGQTFETWSAHAETATTEHESEESGEHGHQGGHEEGELNHERGEHH